MNWLAFVAIAVLLDSIRIYIDNYASDVFYKEKGAVSQKLFYILILIITGFNPFASNLTAIGLLLLSGFLGSISGIPYYRALEIENSTNIGIFIQLAPVFYLILGWLFLGETISGLQFIAFFIILAAPLLILFTTKKRSRKVKIRAITFALIYVLIAVISNLIFVKADTEGLGFVNEIAIMFVAKGITNLLIIYSHPKWRKRFACLRCIFARISCRFRFCRTYRNVLPWHRLNSNLAKVWPRKTQSQISYRSSCCNAPHCRRRYSASILKTML